MDIKKLLIRSASGLVYCALIVGCIIWGETGVLILACLFSILGCLEFSKLIRGSESRFRPEIALDILGCIALSMSYMGLPLLIWALIIMARFILQLYDKEVNPLRSLSDSMLGQIYIGFPMCVMTGIAYFFNPMMLLPVFFLIWINDTGAFLVGSSCGRHRLFERISPKKSWEGFFGGLIFCIAASILFYYFCNDYFKLTTIHANLAIWIGLGVIVSVFGTWGDLIESMFKRNQHVKDSGHLIPGHGGILDRIDSLLLVLPATAIYFLLILFF
ncbi:MAG: phosphatidate cytidylyltransferase [Muribaculaceae bacterium]|nr:phosphatidate cytidylyltransferase [Muribaculaceae bacterium]